MLFPVRPLKIALVPEPVMLVPPGEAVTVHVPDAGKLLKLTLPVETLQLGCVIFDIIGAVGNGLTITFVESDIVQPPVL
ncbi:hypothetical protein [Flavobacterium davisii]|uniref:Uncharacterized protein n=1 Tax=Flavobacterium columnare TaxID=996 RepID=A0A8G0KTI4_9FLAO|nr:hypothetical protein [Flavobacterium davisii]QYS89858.1 hypothetical protein JJC05_06670 [Flavobacterium davisii]